MNILFFGDLVGKPARMALKQVLPIYKEKYKIDLTIANADNLAHGKGVTKNTVKEMIEYGVNLLTCGDHVWDTNQALEILKEESYNFICPANYPILSHKKGYKIIEINSKKVLVVNLIGRVFLKDHPDCPFRTIDKILKENDKNFDVAIVDLHSEATSEKKALGFYLDSKVSAVLGTHTHIQTADEEISDSGTAYISDVGMVGPKDSILGCKKESVINQMMTQTKFRYEISSDENVMINAVVMEVNQESGKAKSIKRVNEVVKICP
ncbi:MAG: TIGR00282 family metallophosphoesterase [Patescibacteria group bacterium]|nr:TIGR00282 family metallophosphoesterase [Patescibacteria group bacterium]